MTAEQNQKTFVSCVNFVNDLNTVFGKRQHSLQLYNRLISSTNINDVDKVDRHLECFKTFVVANRDQIVSRNRVTLNPTQIVFTNKINIKMDEIFRMATSDTNTENQIWRHLLIILMRCDPASATHNNKLQIQPKSRASNEARLIEDLKTKLQSTINPEVAASNPMAAMTTLFTSGVLNDIVKNFTSEMESGNLNINNLMSCVTNMFSEQGTTPPADLTNVLSNLATKLENPQ